MVGRLSKEIGFQQLKLCLEQPTERERQRERQKGDTDLSYGSLVTLNIKGSEGLGQGKEEEDEWKGR